MKNPELFGFWLMTMVVSGVLGFLGGWGWSDSPPIIKVYNQPLDSELVKVTIIEKNWGYYNGEGPINWYLLETEDGQRIPTASHRGKVGDTYLEHYKNLKKYHRPETKDIILDPIKPED